MRRFLMGRSKLCKECGIKYSDITSDIFLHLECKKCRSDGSLEFKPGRPIATCHRCNCSFILDLSLCLQCRQRHLLPLSNESLNQLGLSHITDVPPEVFQHKIFPYYFSSPGNLENFMKTCTTFRKHISRSPCFDKIPKFNDCREKHGYFINSRTYTLPQELDRHRCTCVIQVKDNMFLGTDKGKIVIFDINTKKTTVKDLFKDNQSVNYTIDTLIYLPQTTSEDDNYTKIFIFAKNTHRSNHLYEGYKNKCMLYTHCLHQHHEPQILSDMNYVQHVIQDSYYSFYALVSAGTTTFIDKHSCFCLDKTPKSIPLPLDARQHHGAHIKYLAPFVITLKKRIGPRSFNVFEQKHIVIYSEIKGIRRLIIIKPGDLHTPSRTIKTIKLPNTGSGIAHIVALDRHIAVVYDSGIIWEYDTETGDNWPVGQVSNIRNLYPHYSQKSFSLVRTGNEVLEFELKGCKQE